MEGDGEANYAHYALHKFHLLPGQLAALSREERAFIYASIDVQIEAEKRRAKEAERKSKKRR